MERDRVKRSIGVGLSGLVIERGMMESCYGNGTNAVCWFDRMSN